jgi:hypothetical protein
VNRIHAAGVAVIGGLLAIGALVQFDFFGLFEPDFDRWQKPVPRELIEPRGDPFHLEDLEAFISEMDERSSGLFREGPPAYSQREADSWAAELGPIVETIRGRSFLAPPVLRVVERKALASALARHVSEAWEGFLPALSEEYRERFFAAMAALESVSVLGLYDPADGVLYVVPANVRGVMASADLDERHYEPFLKLVVAHELTHALQDGDTADARQAFQAVLEGHAVFVQELVGTTARDRRHVGRDLAHVRGRGGLRRPPARGRQPCSRGPLRAGLPGRAGLHRAPPRRGRHGARLEHSPSAPAADLDDQQPRHVRAVAAQRPRLS